MVLEASQQLAPVLMEPISLLGILKIASCLWLIFINYDWLGNNLIGKCVDANGKVYIHKKCICEIKILKLFCKDFIN